MIAAVAKFVVSKLPKRDSSMSETNKQPVNALAATGNWTREQSLLAFRCYCETPYGQLHSKNKRVIELAELIGRTPSALAMKCVNFASLDPVIRESGRSGLKNASVLDKTIWDDFHSNWDRLFEECAVLQARLQLERHITPESLSDDEEVEEPDFTGETRKAWVQQRVKQNFFRRAVLISYRGRCCVSGVSDRRFLVASHIVAWKDDAAIRLHPGNGLCLSAIHDKAFDKHLFSLTDDHRIILSGQLMKTQDKFLQQVFWPVDDKQIALPERFAPETAFITRHRRKMQECAQ
jgi:hypothetical protein